MTREFTLLSIDDEEQMRRSIRVFFQDSGFRVLEAADSSAGLAVFREKKPDLVLVDLRMPGMGGLEVIDTLSRESPGTPIVVLSGTGVIGDAIEAIRRGAWDYVMKPVADMAQLEHVVRTALERAQLRQERQRHQERLEEEVTQRTQELMEEKRFSELIVENLPGLFFIIDDQGKVVHWNKESKHIGGYSKEEMTRMRPADFFVPEDRESILRGMSDVFHRGRAELEVLLLTKSGKRIPFYLVGVRQRLRNKDHIMGFGIDISARRELEEQLLQSQKMEAIGTLAGGIAHDFNNLLQVMNGYSEIALSQLEAGTRGHDSVKQVLAAGGRAATLVSQLLMFSRRQVMKTESLDLNAVVSELLKMLRRIIGEHIRLQFAPGPLLGIIQADRGMIEQVLMNLCVNARDAMPQGGDLFIETRRALIDDQFCENHLEATPGPYALLKVTDTGCGMSSEIRQRIFEPFFTTKEAGKGTGLGLAAVFGIVKLHEGILTCTSEEGKGTCFDVYLPALTGPASTLEESEKHLAPGGKETILLAEDDDMVRTLTVEFLNQAGYTVLSAADGDEAKGLFERYRNSIDLLILDVVMPKTGGRAVYDWARTLKPGIACVFCSGYAEIAIHKAFVLDTGLELLRKPYRCDDLLHAVRRVIDEAKSIHTK